MLRDVSVDANAAATSVNAAAIATINAKRRDINLTFLP